MAVKPMTQQGQWVCFGSDRAFAYKIETGRVLPFESTPNGWNLTVELEALDDANSKLQEVMDIMMTEKHLEQTEKFEHMNRRHILLSGAGHRPARPRERSLAPLIGTDGDETMMDKPGDDAGETNAVKSKIQPLKPSDQQIATHEACGHHPYRDRCRTCVGGAGRSDA